MDALTADQFKHIHQVLHDSGACVLHDECFQDQEHPNYRIEDFKPGTKIGLFWPIGRRRTEQRIYTIESVRRSTRPRSLCSLKRYVCSFGQEQIQISFLSKDEILEWTTRTCMKWFTPEQEEEENPQEPNQKKLKLQDDGTPSCGCYSFPSSTMSVSKNLKGQPITPMAGMEGIVLNKVPEIKKSIRCAPDYQWEALYEALDISSHPPPPPPPTTSFRFSSKWSTPSLMMTPLSFD